MLRLDDAGWDASNSKLFLVFLECLDLTMPASCENASFFVECLDLCRFEMLRLPLSESKVGVACLKFGRLAS